MSQEYIELRGSRAVELARLNRILSELAGPTLDGEAIAPSTQAAMAEVGIVVGGNASRRDLIARLWGRKRSMLRQASSTGDWGPMQPVA